MPAGQAPYKSSSSSSSGGGSSFASSFGDADTWSSIGGVANDLFSAFGSFKAADAEGHASNLSNQQARYTDLSTSIQKVQSDRNLYQVLGGMQSDVAGAGFKMSGSALDLMRSSAAQGALDKQLLTMQGEITAAGYRQQGDAYGQQAAGSSASGFADLIGGAVQIAGMFF